MARASRGSRDRVALQYLETTQGKEIVLNSLIESDSILVDAGTIVDRGATAWISCLIDQSDEENFSCG